ncbi:Ribonuclease HIII [subsurface metagenome]
MSEGTKYDVEIRNVVAVGSLDQKLDLLAILKVFRNAEYRPKRFPGLVFKLKQPKTATLIFTSGKMVCTGAKSEKIAISAVRKVVRELRKAGFIIRRGPKIEVVNMVGTADVGGVVDLETAAEFLDNTMYEPEQFPGLIYRMEEPKVVILLFRSGKVVLKGGKREKEVHEATEKMVSILTENELIY